MSQTLDPMPQAANDKRHEKTRVDFYKSIGLSGMEGPLNEAASRTLDKQIAKSDKKQHKKNVPAAKAKVLYQDRLVRAKATVTELEDYRPVSQPLIKLFTDMIDKAEKQLGENLAANDAEAWAKATKVLHEQHVSKAMQNAEELWAARTGTVRDNKAARPVYQQIDTVRRGIADAGPMLTDSVLDGLSVRVDQAERYLVGSDLSPVAIKIATAMLDDAQTEAGNAAKAANKLATAAQTSQAAAQRSLDALRTSGEGNPLTTEADEALLLRAMRDAQTAMGVRKFALAKLQFDDLVSRAGTLQEANLRDRNAWQAQAQAMTALNEDAAAFAGTAASPEVREDAAAIARRVAELAVLVPGKDVSYRDATGRITGGQVQLAALRERDEAFKAFGAARVEAARRIEHQAEAVDVAFTRLRAAALAATNGKKNDIADGEFMARLEKAKADWAGRLLTAHDLPTLDEGKMAAELVAIADAITKAAADPATVAQHVAAGELDLARKPFEAARKTAGDQVAAFMAWDAVKGGTFLAQMREQDAIVARLASPGGYAAAREEMVRIGADAVDGLWKQRDIVSGLQIRLEGIVADMTGPLRDLFEAATGMRNEAKSKDTLALQATLQAGADELRALGKTTQLPLLNQAIDEGVVLANDIASALAAANGKTLEGGTEPYSFAEARKALAKVKQKLADDTLQTYCTPGAAALSDRVAELEKALGGQAPSALHKTVDEIVTAAATLTTAAAKAKTDADAFKTELDKLGKRLEAAPYKDAKACAAKLKADIASIYSNACYEGGLKGAEESRDALVVRLDALKQGWATGGELPPALAAAEDAEVAQKRAQELAKSKFDAEVIVLKKQVAALETYPDDKAGLLSSLKEIEDAGKKSGDIEQQRDLLQGVRDRLALLSANPHGLGIHVRKQLPAVNKRWKAAVGGFVAGIGQVDTAIAKLADTDLDPAGKAAVKKALGAVSVLFNVVVFEKALAAVANEGTAEAERSTAREAVLRDVRRNAAYLQNDYRLQQLLDCPWLPGMRSLLSELNLALLDLENNVLVSM